MKILLHAIVSLGVCLPAHAETSRPAIRVALTPVIVDRMSGIAWKAMTAECNRIWTREGIAVTWSDAESNRDADLVLPLVFDHREVRKHDRKDGDAFGVTTFAGRSQRILVSIDRAREVVAQRHGLADSSDGMTLDIAMGTVLGRVVAHEVGHALLLTLAHATDGLMRPNIDADDLRPAFDGQFALAAPDRNRIAMRFSNTPGREPMPGTVTWRDVSPVPSPRRAPR